MFDPATITAGAALVNALKGSPSSNMAPISQTALSGAPVDILQDFDFSGFTVATGGSKATGAPNNKVSTPKSPGGPVYEPQQGGMDSSLLPGLIIGGAALAGMLWAR